MSDRPDRAAAIADLSRAVAEVMNVGISGLAGAAGTLWLTGGLPAPFITEASF